MELNIYTADTFIHVEIAAEYILFLCAFSSCDTNWAMFCMENQNSYQLSWELCREKIDPTLTIDTGKCFLIYLYGGGMRDDISIISIATKNFHHQHLAARLHTVWSYNLEISQDQEKWGWIVEVLNQSPTKYHYQYKETSPQEILTRVEKCRY